MGPEETTNQGAQTTPDGSPGPGGGPGVGIADAPPIETSRTPATVGRVVHVYSSLWEGEQPGMVTRGPLPSVDQVRAGATQQANVNVMLDGVNNFNVLQVFRGRAEGNTVRACRVYDALDPLQRAQLRVQIAGAFAPGEPVFWAEWPAKV